MPMAGVRREPSSTSGSGRSALRTTAFWVGLLFSLAFSVPAPFAALVADWAHRGLGYAIEDGALEDSLLI